MLFWKMCVIICGLVGLTSIHDAVAGDRRDENTRRVRLIYLVSSDREARPEYTAALGHAIRDLQAWYGKQLGGPTFRLSNPVVEVVKTSQKAAWFYSNPNGENADDWGFNNTLDEAHKLVGATSDDPKYVWVIYSDGPGNKGRGGNGVTCLPEDDLLGLVGKHPTQKDKSRWIAGLGHEMGHAFGLEHPDDPAKDADAIMWTGIYGKYPNQAYLTVADKATLLQSPFFFNKDNTPVVKAPKIVARFVYDGGSFDQVEGKQPIIWTETNAKGEEAFTFEEKRRDEHFIYLIDKSRNMWLRLPVSGGESAWSIDDEKSWTVLYHVEKAVLSDR